jgi:hypothetical protein
MWMLQNVGESYGKKWVRYKYPRSSKSIENKGQFENRTSI